MPVSKRTSWAFATISSSCSRPIVARIGMTWLELAVGLALCATRQIEHEADSVRLGWLWVDSSTAVHNIKDRQSHVSHRPVNRIRSCNGLDSPQLITVASPKTMLGKLLWELSITVAPASLAVVGRLAPTA